MNSLAVLGTCNQLETAIAQRSVRKLPAGIAIFPTAHSLPSRYNHEPPLILLRDMCNKSLRKFYRVQSIP